MRTNKIKRIAIILIGVCCMLGGCAGFLGQALNDINCSITQADGINCDGGVNIRLPIESD